MRTLQITDGLRKACVDMLKPDSDDLDVRAVVRAIAYCVLNQTEIVAVVREGPPTRDPADVVANPSPMPKWKPVQPSEPAKCPACGKLDHEDGGCQASSEPASEVTTEALDGMALSECTTFAHQIRNAFHADIRANIDRATAADRARIAELTKQVEDFREIYHRENERFVAEHAKVYEDNAKLRQQPAKEGA